MPNFTLFAQAVYDNYQEMQNHELYVVDADPDVLWAIYLDSFPEGTNEVYRERREHDCSCCRHFIKHLGPVVAIINGSIRSVWDTPDVEFPYDVVSQAMLEHVQSLPIKRIFRSAESQYGNESTPELQGDKLVNWHHFHGDIHKDHRLKDDKLGPFQSQMESTLQVMRRGFTELTECALIDVIDLITSKSLYRGEEHLPAVRSFQQLAQSYISSGNGDLFIWQNLKHPAARFRNTVIGSLVVDLSNGVDLTEAVKMFESKVAPQNYKRSSSVITPRMIDNALDTLGDLGLREAVDRRHATITQVSVNDVVFVDNQVKPLLQDTLKESLMTQVKKPKITNATSIAFSDFLTDVVSDSVSISAVVEPKHLSRFMSVTAPVFDTGHLFKWDNDFAWSYDGDYADSVKQRVKRAGGNVDANFRVSLSWFNKDDLDIHCIHEKFGHIYFNNRQGILDVDMNADRLVRDPVENLSWNTITDGEYRIWVNQFRRRETIDSGFELEVELMGERYHFVSDTSPRKDSEHLVIRIKDKKLLSIHGEGDIKPGSNHQEKWGIKTGELVTVNALISSPNYWKNNNVGNRHWFFLLDGCLNPDPVRGIYNEFLKPELMEHRKVFEVLGAKTKAPYSDEQLSGIGFSSTQRETLTVVTQSNAGNSNTFNLHFGESQ